MATKSKNKYINVLKIFFEGLYIYIKDIDIYIKCMLFPVLGQIAGLFLILMINYYFVINLKNLINNYQVLNNISLMFTLLLVCVAPAFVIFVRAFYKYIIAIGALNSVAYVARGKSKKPLDPQTHFDLIKKRSFKYIVFLFLLSLILLIGFIPVFIVPFLILAVYLSLVFQVFAFEEKANVFEIFARSISLVKGNYWATTLLLILSFITTYVCLPSLFVWFLEQINVMQYLSIPVQNYLDLMPLKEILDGILMQFSSMTNLNNYIELDINSVLNIEKIAISLTETITMFVVIMFTLPLRDIWFTYLYSMFETEKSIALRKAEK